MNSDQSEVEEKRNEQKFEVFIADALAVNPTLSRNIAELQLVPKQWI